ADDEVVGILDHLLYCLVGKRAIENHGVPVLLVEVVAGNDGRMRLAQGLRQSRLALDADPQRLLAEPRERKHLPSHLEDRRLGIEGKRLLRSGEREAASAKPISRHRPIIAY